MAKRYRKRDLERMVYAAIAAYLHKGSIIDTMDQNFIDQVFPVQLEMARRFEAVARDVQLPAEVLS